MQSRPVLVQNVVNYYFGRTSIAPQDVSQQLFKFNLTDISSQLDSPLVITLVNASQSSGGQALVARANASDRDNINALPVRLSSLSSDISTLNTQIQVPMPFAPLFHNRLPFTAVGLPGDMD